MSGLVENPNKCIILLIPNPHRSGEYELSEAEGVQRGTKIVIHLKGECYDYCKEEVIKGELSWHRKMYLMLVSCHGKFVVAFWFYSPLTISGHFEGGHLS